MKEEHLGQPCSGSSMRAESGLRTRAGRAPVPAAGGEGGPPPVGDVRVPAADARVPRQGGGLHQATLWATRGKGSLLSTLKVCRQLTCRDGRVRNV